MLPLERLKANNTIENLWLYILIIAKRNPVYAYELRKRIEKEFGFKPGMVSSYRVLYRLEMDGFVKSKKAERRRVYFITKKGEQELKKAKDFYKKIIHSL